MAHLDSFRTARWLRTFNLVLQAGLFLSLFLGLNYLARSHAWRFDLTQHRRYSLSPETLSWVKNLPQPVTIIATLSHNHENPELRGLLEEYKHATATRPAGKITVEYLDVYERRRRAEELHVEQPNTITLVCADRRRVVLVDELYRMKQKQRDAFLGEQALTAALLDVADPNRKKIYFLVGHSELRPEDPEPQHGLSALRDQLRLRNFDVSSVDLTIERKIPADAALLISVAPQTSFSRAEQELLRQYLGANAGRLILLLAPGIGTSALGLQDLLLDDWGVIVDDDILYDTGKENTTDDGDLLIHAFHQQHPIMRSLFDTGAWLRFGATRSLRPDPTRSASNGLNTVALAAASPAARGDRDYRNRTGPKADPIRPLPGLEGRDGLGVIVASEKVAVKDNLPFSVRGGRLVVFGTGDFVDNERLGSAGNFTVFLGAINWTVDRDAQLSIPPRQIERFRLSLSAGDLLNLRYALLLALPGASLLLGLLVYWTRRS
ncbi:MAG: ABC transporter [Opitutus sp.]|nr:ABC transporter [Opitutus sp.]